MIELLRVTPPQAYRLLQKLVKEGRLVLEGNKNGACYKITNGKANEKASSAK